MNFTKFCIGLFSFLTLCFHNLYGQRQSWYFPDYKHYFRPDSSCNQNVIKSIQSRQYLKIKVYDDCRHVEISCYRSKDSTLKEKGLYYNTGETAMQKGVANQAGTDSIRIVEKSFLVFKRLGVWKYYNRAGRVIKTVKYKEP